VNAGRLPELQDAREGNQILTKQFEERQVCKFELFAMILSLFLE